MDLSRGNRSQNPRGITLFRSWEARATIQERHTILAGEGNGVFDGRVPGTDDYEALASVRFRRFQRVLNARQIAPRHVQATRIALHAQSQDYVFGTHGAARLQAQCEIALGAVDRGDLRAVPDVDLACLDGTLPGCEDLFPATRREFDIAAQGQNARLCHHMLVMLV